MTVHDRIRGKFLVLDGPDGCGKSSQSRMLMDWLAGRGVAAAGFRNPGTTVIGEKVREILLTPAHEAMTTPAEVLLCMAAHVQPWGRRWLLRGYLEKSRPSPLDKVECCVYARVSDVLCTALRP